MAVFDIIQEKLLRLNSDIRTIRRKAGPRPPCSSSITYLVDNLPAGSRLLIMMVMFHRDSDCRKVRKNLDYHSNIPASFLALVYLENFKHLTALNCTTCQDGRDHTRDRGHTKDDCLSPSDMIYKYSCLYHEHGDDDDEHVLCFDAWESRFMMLRAEEAVEYPAA